MITTTIHKSCIALVDILKERGIRNVVLSPGSRNAPLSTAFSRDDFFDKIIIIDERAAAFCALGMAQQCGLTITEETPNGCSFNVQSEEQAHKLLNMIISSDIPLIKYELREPNLNELFIEKAGAKNED